MNDKRKTGLEWFILFVLAIRPALDVFTDVGVAIGPLRLNPAAAIGLLVILAALLYIFLLPWQTQKTSFKFLLPRAFLIWLVCLLGWAFMPMGATYLHETNRFIGLREWIRLLSIFFLFLALFFMARQGKTQAILHALFLSFIIPALTGLYQIFFHHGLLVKDVYRVNATFVHPNPFAFYLVLLLGVTFWQWRWSPRKFAWSLLLLLELGLLISTFSFTGVAMFGAMVLVIILGESRRLRWIGLGLILLFAIAFLATPTGWQRVKTELQLEQLDEIERTGRETSSITWRLLNWRFLYREWKKEPWFGHGLNTSKYINPMVKKGTGLGFDPHNDYVRYLAETGAIGLALFLGFLFSIGLALWRAYTRTCISQWKHGMLISIAIYTSWLVGSCSDNLITATGYQFALWAILALAVGTPSFNQANTQESNS
ncbi:hypothetical protein GF373_10370 [bacterium]|nr:hypothetical protein [bacterium]